MYLFHVLQLVTVVVDPWPIPGIFSMKQVYIPDRKPVHHLAHCFSPTPCLTSCFQRKCIKIQNQFMSLNHFTGISNQRQAEYIFIDMSLHKK